MLGIPQVYYQVHYNSKRIPGVKQQENLSLGANCQVFAYAVLKYFGKSLPDFRSSELWDDDIFTLSVDKFWPLDIMLYHSVPKAYGAHVGLYLGDGKVLHLSRANRIPKIETHEQLVAQEKYQFFIGAKRVLEIASLD